MATPKRALVIVDIQQQYFSGPLEIHFPAKEKSLAKITEVIDAATSAGIPVVAVQHTAGEGAPIFDPNTPEFAVHPEVEKRTTESWKHLTKQYSSVYAGTDLTDWLRSKDVDTVTLVGYMSNNCILASAVDAEFLGFTTEVISDATGAINIANDAGFADAKTVHQTLMTLLNSSWARVSDADEWVRALTAGAPTQGSDLGSSAIAGADRARHA